MRVALTAALAVAGVVAAGRPASAQTFAWLGGGGTGNWSSSANWSTAVPPVGGADAAQLEFDGTPAQTNTVNDRVNTANPFFRLNRLTVGAGAANGFTISGGPLRFVGTGSQIVVNGGPGVRLNVAAAVEFADATTIDLTTNSTAADRELALSGGITGAGGLTVTTSGATPFGREIAIGGANGSYSGTLTVQSGRADLLAVNALSRAATVVLSGGELTNVNGAADAGIPGLPVGAFAQQFGTFGGTAGTLTIGESNPSAVLAGFSNAGTSYGGSFRMNNAGSRFAKVGTGTLTYTGNTTSGLIGTVSVRGGALDLVGNTGTAGGFNTASGGAVEVYVGAEYRQTVTGTGTNGRFANAGTVTLLGGTVRLDGTGLGASATGYTDAAGPLAAAAGDGVVRIDAAAGRGANLNFASLTAPGTAATLSFQSASLGLFPADTAGTGNVFFALAPTALLVGGGGAAGTTTVSVLPFAAGGPVGGPPAALVTYGANGVRGLTDAEYATAFGGATDNVRLTGSPILGAAATANALRLDAGLGTFTLNAGLTLTSGSLLNLGSGATLTGAGPLSFGTGGAGTAYLYAAQPLTIGVPVSAAHLAKAGSGTVTVQSAVSLGNGGVVSVNAGTLALGAGASVSSANGAVDFRVFRGATLNAPAGGLALTTGTRTLTGGGTVGGRTDVGAGGTIAPSSLGGPTAGLAAPGMLTAASVRFLPGGEYRWYHSSVLPGEYTQSRLDVTGELDLSGLSAATRFTVRLDALTPAHQDSTTGAYDFDPLKSYTWTLVTAGSVTGFSADKFALNTSEYGAAVGVGEFAVAQSGNNLVVTYAPVPEPTAALLLAAAGLAVGGWRGRRLRASVL